MRNTNAVDTKKVIITGANGFLGAALTAYLAEQGTLVYAVVREKTKLVPSLQHENVQVIYCDLRDIINLHKKIAPTSFDAFYHFAWAGTSGSERADYALQLENVRHCCDAVTAAKKLDCAKFIFAGSIMEYEAMAYLPTTTEAPAASYIYSTAKLTAHFMAKTWAGACGIDFIETIISNVYGVGEHSDRLINTTIKSYLHNQPVSFSAGEQMYDFIYITDAVAAFAVIGEKGLGGKNYYIGNAAVRPLKEFIAELHACMKPGFPLVLGEIPFKGAMLTYGEFDTRALEREFSLFPQVSFKEGVMRLADWLKAREVE